MAARYGKKRKLLPEIPPDVLMEEIIPRLPCKSLARWSCVSKQWNSLILRLRNSARSSGCITGHKVLLGTNPFRFMNLDVTNFGSRVIRRGRTPPPLIPDDSTFTEVVGECSGLFCIVAICVDFNTRRATRRFILWNPTTGESEQVCSNDVGIVVVGHPHRDGRSQIEPLPETFHMCGFGYDSSSDDYKIVCLEGSQAMPLSVQIYTVGGQTWKNMEHPVSDIFLGAPCFHNRGSFLRGACHWPIRKFDGRRNAILSFDFETEHVREVMLPPCFSESEFFSQELRVFDGKLVVTNQYNNNEVEIWVMNEYGVGSSFTKKVTLAEIPKSQSLRSFIPVCFMRNGCVLLFDGKRLIGYDLEKKTYKVVVARGCRQDISVYTESLISPRMMKKIRNG